MEQKATQVGDPADLLAETLSTIWRNYQNIGDDTNAKVSVCMCIYVFMYNWVFFTLDMLKFIYISVTLDRTFFILFSICGGGGFTIKLYKKVKKTKAL